MGCAIVWFKRCVGDSACMQRQSHRCWPEMSSGSRGAPHKLPDKKGFYKAWKIANADSVVHFYPQFSPCTTQPPNPKSSPKALKQYSSPHQSHNLNPPTPQHPLPPSQAKGSLHLETQHAALSAGLGDQ